MVFNKPTLIGGVERLADVMWTTTNLEQCHGSAALIHKVHNAYHTDMFAQRAFVHMERPMVFVR